MIHWPDGKIHLPRSIEHDFSSHAVLACEQALCLGEKSSVILAHCTYYLPIFRNPPLPPSAVGDQFNHDTHQCM